MKYSSSKQLIKNTRNFLKIRHYSFFSKSYPTPLSFYGWGRKKSGKKALELATENKTSHVLLEDGFIRSIGLGVTGSPSFSIVEDNLGIYYDATVPSKLENIFNSYNFTYDITLMNTAKEAMQLIRQYQISKYNNAPNIEDDFFSNDRSEKVLIIAQTEGDASLEFGFAYKFTTMQMINDAMQENPQASVYIKIHPDVHIGKKKSDISIDEIPKDCIILDENINPIALLKNFTKVYTKTSGMGMEALILGLEVHCYGLPYYAGWGLTIDKQTCDRRKRRLKTDELFAGAYILYTRYYNPYKQQPSDIIDTIKTIMHYKNRLEDSRGKLYFFGFSRWKQNQTRRFFSSYTKNTITFSNTLEKALAKGLNRDSKIYIWGKKSFIDVEAYAKEENISILRVEDGFIRSVSLGSDLTKAYSLVVDSRGIYFDPTQESDLEHILNTYSFDNDILERSAKLQEYLIENKISKYNSEKDTKIHLQNLQKHQTVIMVPGQVEDDASIIYGAKGMSNLELLIQTRKAKPDAYIIYKPHPDVLAGNRKGNVPKDIALEHCNTIISGTSIDSVLALCDEVHTMTSLVGLEALIRGKKVYTYGMPFYAGWGLTVDSKVCHRRTTVRTIDELVAATFILYPRYIDKDTNKLCEVEVLLSQIEKEKQKYNQVKLYRIYVKSRNFVSRKIQLFLKIILGG
ncbi:MAG: capsular polysaccharide biosynthesis protein [Sulfurovum sp.]|nr:capsular polysaccharide biosynthesis protein [Sulfurovum sp.]